MATAAGNGPAAMVYSLLVFDRHCDCIFHLDLVSNPAFATPLDRAENAKLVYGVVFSARNLVAKLRPEPAADAPFLAYSTSNYKLHYYETPTSLKFVLLTSTRLATAKVRDALRSVHHDAYVPHVALNPLATATAPPNLIKLKKKPLPDPTVPPAAYITNAAFRSAVEGILSELQLNACD
ncbi:Sybindin-like family-domain-containing protein [Blastocladiella britannica]|nr:Sybindin-like family-domain-containing protein [Blastocladiella britannica]